MSFLHWSFPVLRIFGITIRMHWMMAILIAVYMLRGATSGHGFALGLGFMAVTMSMLLITIVLHELCHCWMAIRLGGGAEQILLWPLGGLAFVHFHQTPMNQIKVSGVGPLSNFVIGGICLGVLMLTGASWDWNYLNPLLDWTPMELTTTQWFILAAVRLNIILGLFNLIIPVYPMDGGKVLLMALTIRYGKERAAEISTYIGFPVGIAMTVFGFAQFNFILGLIGIWVLLETFNMRKFLKMGELNSHPVFHGIDEFEYLQDPMAKIRATQPERKPGFFARWRAKRARKRAQQEAEEARVIADRVDAVLEKVSREGIGSLTPDEKSVLDKASKRNRGGE